MSASKFRVLSAVDQLARTEAWVNDPRGVIPSGIPDLDEHLYRGGFVPGNLVVLGGRTGTRKTTVSTDIMSRLIKAGRNVGLIGLDEQVPSYVLKLMSAMYGEGPEHLAENWDRLDELKARYKEEVGPHFVESHGYRPSVEALDVWWNEANDIIESKVEVVFIDYLSIMDKGQYGSAKDKVTETIEGIQVWTNERELVTVVLHQVGRFESGGSNRDEGQLPMSASRLKYAGEEIADIVLGTYRPALDPIGNAASYYEAKALDRDLDNDEYEEAVDRVRRNQEFTYLQLLKNRNGKQPGQKARRGIKLKSVGDTMQMLSPSERREA